jgi:hypothetical protein
LHLKALFGLEHQVYRFFHQMTVREMAAKAARQAVELITLAAAIGKIVVDK